MTTQPPETTEGSQEEDAPTTEAGTEAEGAAAAEGAAQSAAAPDVDLQAEMDALIEGAAGLFGNLKEIFLKSKDEVARGAQLGKVRIDVFQLRKDREHFLQRLGEEAYDLMVRGDVEHADLTKPFAKVKAIDDRIEAVEAQIEGLVEEQEAARQAAADSDAANSEPGEDTGENG